MMVRWRIVSQGQLVRPDLVGLLAVLQGESKSASGVFSKQKRDTLRQMHMPQGILMLAVPQGMGFVPVPLTSKSNWAS